MGLEAATKEMGARLDQADAETDPQPASPEQCAAWAERRHMFWRRRCLDHARTIDRQLSRIHDLLDDIRRLEKERDEHAAHK